MYTLPEQPTFNKSLYRDQPTKIGGTNKTNRVVISAQRLASIEDEFMDIAYRLSRSENQRNERKRKRG